MMAARAQRALRSRRQPIELAEIAYKELSLPGTFHSHADEERLGRLWRGLKALDDEQAQLRDEVALLLLNHEKTGDAAALVLGLRGLVGMTSEQLEAQNKREFAIKQERELEALIRRLSPRARAAMGRR
jgi:hypothetical protein